MPLEMMFVIILVLSVMTVLTFVVSLGIEKSEQITGFVVSAFFLAVNLVMCSWLYYASCAKPIYDSVDVKVAHVDGSAISIINDQPTNVNILFGRQFSDGETLHLERLRGGWYRGIHFNNGNYYIKESQ